MVDNGGWSLHRRDEYPPYVWDIENEINDRWVPRVACMRTITVTWTSKTYFAPGTDGEAAVVGDGGFASSGAKTPRLSLRQ
ncbi:hypothetical protein [Amycolatopsis sacchari]|uniref:hypothetical protein n=1 Tax=Amycolatopsis sacchari TaxID=115433 RepID=UPI003D73426A